MICETCQGKGFVRQREISRWSDGDKEIAHLHLPCPTCNGSGVAYCCEGMMVVEIAEKRCKNEFFVSLSGQDAEPR